MTGLWSADKLHAAPASAQSPNTKSLSPAKSASGLPRLTTRSRARDPLPAPNSNVLPRLDSQRLSVRFPNRGVVSLTDTPYVQVGMLKRLSARPSRADAGRPQTPPFRTDTTSADSSVIVYIVQTEPAYAYHKNQKCGQLTRKGVAPSVGVQKASAIAPPDIRLPCILCYGKRKEAAE
jgi:hypothetical protein